MPAGCRQVAVANAEVARLGKEKLADLLISHGIPVDRETLEATRGVLKKYDTLLKHATVYVWEPHYMSIPAEWDSGYND